MTMTTIPDLPTASVANDTDYAMIRQPGSALGVDKKVLVSKLREIDISGLTSLPQPPADSDLLMIRSGSTNYKLRYRDIGFPQDTKMWFYQSTAPTGWRILTSVEDVLLAVKSSSGDYATAGSTGGDWQQVGHVLTQKEMPPHVHNVQAINDRSGKSSGKVVRGKTGSTVDLGYIPTEIRGGANDVNSTRGNIIGGPTDAPASAHNHGDTWRPKSAVGIICYKDFYS